MIKPDKNFITSNLIEMISIPTVNSFWGLLISHTQLKRRWLFFSTALDQLGFETFSQIATQGRRNVWVFFKGKGTGPNILLAGHLDTVGVDGYQDPFYLS